MRGLPQPGAWQEEDRAEPSSCHRTPGGKCRGVQLFEGLGGLRRVRRGRGVETLDVYVEAPRRVVKGTKMAFPGLNKPEDRANVIAYLERFSEWPEGSPAEALPPGAPGFQRLVIACDS